MMVGAAPKAAPSSSESNTPGAIHGAPYSLGCGSGYPPPRELQTAVSGEPLPFCGAFHGEGTPNRDRVCATHSAGICRPRNFSVFANL